MNQPYLQYFINGDVANAYIEYQNSSPTEDVYFIPNWKARHYSWQKFCNSLNQFFKLSYFETREKENTIFIKDQVNLEHNLAGLDIVNFINNKSKPEYHLILCSFSVLLLINNWDKLVYKPKTLTIICPFERIKSNIAFRLFTKSPLPVLKLSYMILYKSCSMFGKLKDVSSSLRDVFEAGDFEKVKRLRISVNEILKIKLDYKCIQKISCPILIVTTKEDKIHNVQDYPKIINSVSNPTVFEAPNFKEVHSANTAEIIIQFISFIKSKLN